MAIACNTHIWVVLNGRAFAQPPFRTDHPNQETHPVVSTELLEQSPDVHPRGVDRDSGVQGDGLVGVPSTQQAGDLALPRCEHERRCQAGPLLLGE